MEIHEKMVPPAALAGELGVTESALAKWRAEGKGPPFCKLGHKIVRYPRSGIERWKSACVKARTTDGASQPAGASC